MLVHAARWWIYTELKVNRALVKGSVGPSQQRYRVVMCISSLFEAPTLDIIEEEN